MKYLIAQPLGGLCNRMRVIVGAAELAKILNKELVVIWTADRTLNAKFSELFEPIPYRVIDVPLASVKQRALWHLLTKILGYKILSNEWVYENAREKELNTWINEVENKNIIINANVEIMYNGDYSIFKPQRKLLSHIIPLDNTIGIHIRRTDNIKAITYSPTSLFVDKIKEDLESNPCLKFYLATDDPDEERLFKDRFPDNIVIFKKNSLDRNNPEAIKEAVIDLYNLSCCNKIYGSYFSSFSDVAALWGGIEKIELKNK